MLIFETVDRLRKLTPDEQAALKDDPNWADMREAQAKLRANAARRFSDTASGTGIGSPALTLRLMDNQ